MDTGIAEDVGDKPVTKRKGSGVTGGGQGHWPRCKPRIREKSGVIWSEDSGLDMSNVKHAGTTQKDEKTQKAVGRWLGK